MSSAPQGWVEASSLIIAAKCDTSPTVASKVFSEQRKDPSSNACDFNILMTKRSGKSSFMANTFVFPGGYVDREDFSSKWWSIFEISGVKRNDLSQLESSIHGPRPPMITQPGILTEKTTNDDLLPPAIAFRISAIRETFEETGILLTTSPSTGLNDVDLKKWQKKIHENPSSFADFCFTTKVCPDIWSLYEWSNWLTPLFVEQKRFDTIFYVCCIDSLPKAVSDENEVSQLKWITPLEMLEEHVQKKAKLAPPQVYELSRMRNFTNLDEFRSFAKEREKHGVERWCPNITKVRDGIICTLPGDDFYGQTLEASQSDLLAQEDIRNFRHLNRMETTGRTHIVVSNIIPGCGHLIPLPYVGSVA
jgi:nucleoside diphosphate-linked moiety X motif protein 19